MTDSPPRPNALARGYDRAVMLMAASGEAARAGHPEVGFEHLFLGILVNGGPGARLLMDAGIDLGRARAAIDALLAEDLASLGIDTPLPSPSASFAEEAARLPVAPRVNELLEECPSSGGDRALLAALVADGGGRVRRLLDRLGVDAGALDPDAPDRPAADPAPADGEGADAPGPQPRGWERTRYDLDVPVSAERVWSLVREPGRRAEWDAGAASARGLGGGAVELTSRDGERTREEITHRVEGREVVWTRDQGERTAPRSLRIVIEPRGHRARLRMTMEWPNALRGRIANRVVRWFAREQLRLHAQAIAQAAASSGLVAK
ncbi:Clp amino terminal domain-containing protein, pathogenicity island component [Nocardiopsis flavescens]|uniref:Clp amino terminal domain-containing protein, pathogenicity island component n=1 Tax=Nocardiopsis flavescens TaxID=758803 RepID=A0A1M6CTV2_9ACTN|nr:SRPBCC family protein [Nocardiopsis flavescens]SHI64380.1 Clp amino terminal domain-containing protein, pathogenicity island component [Nocardiopsis flavescens]